MKQGCLDVLNAGSSSIKFAIYEPGSDLPLRFNGQIQAIGVAPRLKVADAAGRTLAERSWAAAELDHPAAALQILHMCQELLREHRVTAIGHRVVHGGMQFAAPVKVTPISLGRSRALVPLAPLHQPHNLAPIGRSRDAAPHIPQVACFDTAFHRIQPRWRRPSPCRAISRARRPPLRLPRLVLRILVPRLARDRSRPGATRGW